MSLLSLAKAHMFVVVGGGEVNVVVGVVLIFGLRSCVVLEP